MSADKEVYKLLRIYQLVKEDLFILFYVNFTSRSNLVYRQDWANGVGGALLLALNCVKNKMLKDRKLMGGEGGWGRGKTTNCSWESSITSTLLCLKIHSH